MSEDWGLVPEDDMFHEPPSSDRWWTETVWFSWMDPDRNRLGYWYVVIRKNVGVCFGGVLLFDETAVLPWELPTFDWHWHEPLPAQIDLCDLNVMDGMWLKCVDHGKTFTFGFENDDLAIDLRYEALMKPMLTRHTPPFNHGSHIDQPGRVTGTQTLHGVQTRIDCIAMRDRSWGIRAPRRQPQIGYCHATIDESSSFLTISVNRRGHDGIIRGYLMRDGVWSPVSQGVRTVQRDAGGRPATIHIEAQDEMGRSLQTTGTTVSRQVFTTYPDMFCWNSLTRWDLDGRTAWGEDQDVWHPRAWRAFAAEIGATVR